MPNPIAARFSNSPVLAAPERAEEFSNLIQALGNHELAGKLMSESASVGDDDFWFEQDDWRAQLRPYKVKDGILTIPVKGVLLNGFPYQFFGYATGYEYVQRAYERGMADSSVKGIALLMDTPGGEVAGNFDLVDRMFAMRGTKPVKAYAAESAYSAGYSIASVADEIIVSRTGGVGSIGVVTSHVDLSKMMEKNGVKITFIHAGKHKVDGNPYEELSDDTKARIQTRIDSLYNIFVSTVARNRGMDEKDIRATEALTYSAEDAVKVGLADSVGNPHDGIAAFSRETQGANAMSDTTQTPAFAQADLDKARAEGKAEGAKAERERVQGIFALDESKDRREQALNLAMNTEVSVETAKTILAAAPAEKKDTASDQSAAFRAAMANGNPEVGADAAGQDGGDASAESPANRILANARAFGVLPSNKATK